MTRWALVSMLVWAAGCGPSAPEVRGAPVAGSLQAPVVAAPDAGPVEPAVDDEGRYPKGQLHLHSANSPDSPTLPMDVIPRYEELGFDFLVFTDHNYTTEFVYSSDQLLLITGAELTTNLEQCEPPPPDPEEGRCRFHMNALFVPTPAPGEMPWDQPNEEITDFGRLALHQRHLDAIRRLGGVAMLNHPTWHWLVDGELLAELARRGVLLIEIANAGYATWNAGNEQYPGAEAIWDAALTAGVTLWAVASDDAHHYYQHEIDARIADERTPYPPGLGWVMVRARKDAQAIRDAVVRGDFYSSTGVVLADVRVHGGALVIEVDEASPGAHQFTFIGAGGRVLAEQRGRRASFALAGVGRGGYVRAVVTDADGRKAWTQPVRPE